MLTRKIIELFYLFFEGILLFQVAFFGMVYLITRRKDVLYYSLLNLVAAAYFFLNAPGTFLGIDENIVFNSPVYLYVNFAIFLTMIFLHPLFLKQIFSDTLEQYPYVKKVYAFTLYAIPLLYLLFVLIGFLGWKTNIIFYAGHLANGPFCALVLVLNFRQNGYKKLIIYGMLVIFICVISTMALTIRYNAGDNDSILDKYPLAIIKLGMLIDILFFQMALLRRWNEQEKQLDMQRLQSLLSIERLRNKISGELHDNIGSSLSGISMYSHLIRNQMEKGEHEKVKESLLIIQQSSNEMVEKLNDMVWSVTPSQDSLQQVFERLEQYGLEMCKAKNIQFIMHMPVGSGHINFPEEHRYHVYLMAKEAINNAVKYSSASTLKLTVKETPGILEMKISDNGQGFDIKQVEKGNGLNNMEKRMKEIDAGYKLISAPGKGCLIFIQLKISS